MLPSDFYPEIYLELNPDIKKILKTPEKAVEHYLFFGPKENRLYKYSQIPDGCSLKYYFDWIEKKNSNPIYDLPFDKFKPLSILNISKKIYGVYFICCIHNYLDIVKEQLNEVKLSGLYNDTTELLLFVTLFNENDNRLQKIIADFDDQQKIKLISTPENLFEKYAIRNYKKYITTEEDYYIYYFHTKGASKNDIHNKTIYAKRRQILNFFTLKKYNLSLTLLEKYDAVGCALLNYPKTHFSGNFWWSKKSHVTNLDDNINDGYLSPEMYICSCNKGKYVSLNNNTNYSENVDDFIYLTDPQILNNVNDNPINNEDDIHFLKYC